MKNQNKTRLFLWLGILVGVTSTLIVILYQLTKKNNAGVSTIINKYIKIPGEEKKPEEKPIGKPVKPKGNKDDLKIIKGIGPAIETLLNKNGILTYSDLSSTSVSDLKKILEEKNLRLSNPENWPSQAKEL